MQLLDGFRGLKVPEDQNYSNCPSRSSEDFARGLAV
jgi:hypothetical protein